MPEAKMAVSVSARHSDEEIGLGGALANESAARGILREELKAAS